MPARKIRSSSRRPGTTARPGFAPCTRAAAAALTKAYGVLAELTPVLTDPRPKSMAGVLVDKDHPTQTFVFGETKLTVSHDYTFEWASPARHDPVWPGAGGLLGEIGPDEYIVAGNGIIVT